MHWSLLALWMICIACIAGNVAQLMATGSVRMIGLLVCGAWAIQQIHWRIAGQDSIALFLLCDGAIVVAVWRGSRFMTDILVAALMLVCWACYALRMHIGDDAAIWWTNRIAVALQMLLALPWPKVQRINFSISHGSRRAWEPVK